MPLHPQRALELVRGSLHHPHWPQTRKHHRTEWLRHRRYPLQVPRYRRRDHPVAGAERPPGLVLPSQEGQFPLSPASPPREGLLERIRRVYCRLGMATRVPVFPARCPSRWVAAGTTEPEFRRLAGTRSSAPYVPPRIPLRFSRCGGLGGVEYSRDCTPNPGRRQIVAMGRDFAEAGFSFEVSERTRDSPSKP